MALKHVLVALTCAAAFPAMASAQPPAWSIAAKGGCCATSSADGAALAAAVLLPPALTLPADPRADSLAAAVLLPEPAATVAQGCCGAAAAVDHSAHLGHPAPKAEAGAMTDMSCCAQPGRTSAAAAAGGCCQDMKDGGCCQDCGMPCCQSMPPTR